MPVVQHIDKQLHIKIVYYGPGLGGKTTNLEFLHANSRPEMRGKLISLSTEAERTLFFDLLPVDLGTWRQYSIRLHLCTVPGQIAFDQTRRLVLQNVDGIVFVVDSQRAALTGNVESIRNLDRNLRLQGDDPSRKPIVVQFNKRDLRDIYPVDELRFLLGIPEDTIGFEACARTGMGVSETLKGIVKQCLRLVGDPAACREGRSPSILPGVRASLFPGGTPAGVDVPSIPRPPKLPSARKPLVSVRAARLVNAESSAPVGRVRSA